jgi:hypothetical protein
VNDQGPEHREKRLVFCIVIEPRNPSKRVLIPLDPKISDTVETFERLPDVRYVRGWYEIRKVDVVIIAIGASRKPDTANSNSLHSRRSLAFRPCKNSKGPFSRCTSVCASEAVLIELVSAHSLSKTGIFAKKGRRLSAISASSSAKQESRDENKWRKAGFTGLFSRLSPCAFSSICSTRST